MLVDYWISPNKNDDDILEYALNYGIQYSSYYFRISEEIVKQIVFNFKKEIDGPRCACEIGEPQFCFMYCGGWTGTRIRI